MSVQQGGELRESESKQTAEVMLQIHNYDSFQVLELLLSKGFSVYGENKQMFDLNNR